LVGYLGKEIMKNYLLQKFFFFSSKNKKVNIFSAKKRTDLEQKARILEKKGKEKKLLLFVFY